MNTEREPVTPTVELPLSVAVEELTGFEALAIEKRLGLKLENLGGMALMMGTVWAYENRDGKSREWASIQAMTMRELQGYFADEPKADLDDGLEGEMGKGYA